jgi:hypothetical protein
MYGSLSQALPLSRLPDLAAVAIALCLVNVILTDLLLYVADGWVCYRMQNDPKLDLMAERPAIIKAVCNSVPFLGWRVTAAAIAALPSKLDSGVRLCHDQVVMRHVCVYAVAAVHCVVVCITSAFSRAHTARFFGIDTAILRESVQRRALAAASAERPPASASASQHPQAAPRSNTSLHNVVC